MALFRIRKYSEFWPFYLQQHANRTCRGLHYVGTTIAIASLLACIATGNLWYLTVMVFGSYGFAWAGHFVFEKNRSATFQYPWWSLISDLRTMELPVTLAHDITSLLEALGKMTPVAVRQAAFVSPKVQREIASWAC